MLRELSTNQQCQGNKKASLYLRRKETHIRTKLFIMSNADVEAGDSSTEPLISTAATPTSNQRRPLGRCSKFLLITFAALFRVVYALFYMIPCRPNNTNNGFITVAERSMFISAPTINLLSIGIEAFAGAIGPVAVISTGIGNLFTFVAGFYYGKDAVS